MNMLDKKISNAKGEVYNYIIQISIFLERNSYMTYENCLQIITDSRMFCIIASDPLS